VINISAGQQNKQTEKQYFFGTRSKKEEKK
jgi:hypothetical protein